MTCARCGIATHRHRDSGQCMDCDDVLTDIAIADLAAAGWATAEIAAHLGLATQTVKRSRRRMGLQGRPGPQRRRSAA